MLLSFLLREQDESIFFRRKCRHAVLLDYRFRDVTNLIRQILENVCLSVSLCGCLCKRKNCDQCKGFGEN